jgi:NADH:ubiquinone oxidoreductase subunit K
VKGMVDILPIDTGMLLVIVSALLVVIGLYTVVTKRNLIKIIIGMEIIATGVNINFIALSLLKYPGLIDPTSHALAIISILLDGALVGVALGMTIVVFRKFGTLDTDKIRKLRW